MAKKKRKPPAKTEQRAETEAPRKDQAKEDHGGLRPRQPQTQDQKPKTDDHYRQGGEGPG